MPSFDIVSHVNSMEIENAVNIAKKELANRFDFKGTKAEIVLEKTEIKLSAENQFKLKRLAEIVMGKIAKRNIEPKERRAVRAGGVAAGTRSATDQDQSRASRPRSPNKSPASSASRSSK